MAQVILTPQVQDEITRLSKAGQVDAKLLEEFAYFVVQSSQKKPSQSSNPLNVNDLKQAIYQRFNVKNTSELSRTGAFRMATEGMDKLDFRARSSWEVLYRKFVGVLPEEKDQQGYGCINGINVFQYFKPWQVFGLNPKTANKEDIRTAYYNLAKVYHPDNLETGDRAIFEKIEVMYKSIIAGF